MPADRAAGRVADRFRRVTGRSPEGVWRAPGRVNLIGEHTDYNAGLALPFAIDRQTLVAVRRRPDRRAGCWSTHDDTGGLVADLDDLAPGSVAGWGRYPLGVVWAFEQRGFPISGVDILVDSTVPLGGGLSSSAALEGAVAVALDDLSGTGLDRRQLAELCHAAESDFAGVPVGMLDQLAVFGGRKGHGLLIDFRTMAVEAIPLDIGPLVVVDTHVRHANADGNYARRRRDCQDAAEQLGVASLRDATPEVVDLLSGQLRRRARHVVSENDRVIETARRLRVGAGIGDLLSASHVSLRDDFDVSCPELDVVVETALENGAGGARLTGAGFGGCAIVVDADADTISAAVQHRFRQCRFGRPTVFTVIPDDGPGRIR